jgi:hypothetical protein
VALYRIYQASNLEFSKWKFAMPAWLIILITVAALMASISVDEEVYFYVFSVFFYFLP